jgi:hypothetical protein
VKRLPWFAAAFALFATCSTDEQFLCEEAAARLANCCPGFDPKALRCSDAAVTGGGCQPLDSHAVRQAEARCILGLECDGLATVCQRVTERAACDGPICTEAADCSSMCPIFNFGPSTCPGDCVAGRCACTDPNNCDSKPLAPCPAAASPVCP